MRSIEEILSGRDMIAEEFRIINKFWADIRGIQKRRDVGASKNRNLVGAALGARRVNNHEIDIETMVSLTGLGRSSLQKTLAQMTEGKMIVLEKDPNDRRRTLIKPTRALVNQSIDMYEETRALIKEACNMLEVARAEK